MPPRRKRIRSDDSENSTLDSKGPSSGSDIQNIPNTRHQSKKINSEGYDGDCEIENEKNRPTKKGTRSCMGKQKSTNSLNKDSTSSTSAPATEEMDVDLLGFERLVTPLPLSPLPCHLVSTPAQLTPELLNVRGSQIKCKSPVVMAAPKLLFETPIEKPEKKTKRKRIARHRQAQHRPKLVTEDEALMISHFNDIDEHELLIE